MKIFKFDIVLVAICLSLFFSCSKNDVEVANSTIALNSCVPIEKKKNLPNICFDSLITDCRCPSDVVCIWEGYAQVKLSLNLNEGKTSFYLSTLGINFLSPRDTIINGYRIKLINVTPYPSFNNPSYETPKVELEISK